jgi:diacylglycerol kinase family enzyme
VTPLEESGKDLLCDVCEVAYADGERVGPLPVSITVLRGALPVIRGDAGA